MKTKIGNAIAWLTIVAMASTLVVAVYWAFVDYRQPAIEIMSDPVVLQKEVAPGEQVLVQWQIRHLRSCPGVLYRGLAGSEFTLALDTVQSLVEGGESTKLATLVKIPSALPPGRYALLVTGHFQCNPLRNPKIRFPEAQISVVSLEAAT